MLAAQIHDFGAPEVIVVGERPPPSAPRRDELLVAVAASSVNGTDLGLRRGDLRVAMVGRMPFTLGFDLAGTVLRCGPDVTAFHPGDRVVALLDHGGGGQAEHVVLRQHRAARAPRQVSSTAAAALPLSGLTALQALYGRAHLHARPAGSRVLVIGATGGIGCFAVQLAKLSGAHVTAVGSTPKLAAMTALGADDVIARDDAGAINDHERWDVVLDAHGSTTLRGAQRLLRPQGVLVSSRPVSASSLVARTGVARGRYTTVATRARSQDLTRLAALVDAGALRIPVDSVHPFRDAAGAHRRAEGTATGKVVLQVRDDYVAP